MNTSASRKRPVFAAVALLLPLTGLLAGQGLPLSLASGGQNKASKEPVVAVVPADSPRPLIAVWRRFARNKYTPDPPYLRIAIWDDGRVLFSADSKKWSHKLREGRIATGQVATLKKQIAATPIFQLKGPHYVVVDAPVDCVLVNIGKKQRILSSCDYGTPTKQKGDEVDECWKRLNRIALAHRPATSTPVKGRFKETPESWYRNITEAGE